MELCSEMKRKAKNKETIRSKKKCHMLRLEYRICQIYKDKKSAKKREQHVITLLKEFPLCYRCPAWAEHPTWVEHLYHMLSYLLGTGHNVLQNQQSIAM
jgi:hypothetical protein